MKKPVDILQEYWGFSSFRDLQEEIINSVLRGKDTLALLPTGGGKSICFQVPAMILEGTCLVISPLIALMKDQVDNLNNRNIKAEAIFSGMPHREIDRILDNCAYGNIKFLYVSPERLETDLFWERVKKINVSLLAVDEAHCISEWGYDFRPSYLHIAAIRELIPGVPVMALTASATPPVKSDILEKLEIPAAAVFSKSFDRPNLIYGVTDAEHKYVKLLEVVKKIKGTGIVYVQSRKATKKISEFLLQNKVEADFYHAGLSHRERLEKQDNWIKNKTRIIVCTNAFGMGIDKPDVRFVIHIEPPSTLESYYQEAGRAGRDLKRSFALIIKKDVEEKEIREKLNSQLPEIKEIKRVYEALGNYFQIPVGSGENGSYDFNTAAFCKNYNFSPFMAMAALKILEEEEFLAITESAFIPSRMTITAQNREIYEFQVKNPMYDSFLKIIFRSYGGIHDNYVSIDEGLIAKRNNMNIKEVKTFLNRLQALNLIDYQPVKELPQITFLQPRYSTTHLQLNHKEIKRRQEVKKEKLNKVLDYTYHHEACRGNYILHYFGEKTTDDCGHCDYCLRKKENPETMKITIEKKAINLLQVRALPFSELLNNFDPEQREQATEVIRELIDRNFFKLEGDLISLES